jgi:DNA end-binding protein Ku
MARSLWSGSLSFGLVNVPVALYSGVVDTDVHFHQLHAKDHTPVETHRYCAEEDAEVPYEEIVNGYETDDDELIMLTDAELAAAAPRRTRTIDIEAFVDVADVHPLYFDHPYVLMPSGEAEGTQRAYRLLVEAMSRTERAALGRFVMRTKERLALIRAHDGRLVLTTLLWHDEVRATKDVPSPTKKDKPKPKQVEQAVELIETLGCPWDPSRYEDQYEKRLKQIVRRKQKGQTIEQPEPEEAEELEEGVEEGVAEEAPEGAAEAPPEPGAEAAGESGTVEG